MTLYAVTMAPGLLWGDSGEAQLRVLTQSIRGERSLARAHSAYYAIAIALHRAFSMEAARAANLAAAIAGAVTVANVGALVACIASRRTSIIAATCMLMFSHTLWQMSTGAEVVTFYAMFMTGELLAMWIFVSTRRHVWFAAAMLLNGLAFSTHNFALLFLPAYALIAWHALRDRWMPAKWILLSVVAWCIGAGGVFALCVAELSGGASTGQVAASLLFGRFEDQVLNASLSMNMLGRVAGMVVYNFPSPLILLCVAGWWWGRRETPFLFWLFATCAAALVTCFAVRYNVPDQYTFMVPSYVFMTIFSAVGIEWWLCNRPSDFAKIGLIAMAMIAPVVYAATPSLVRRFAPRVIPKSVARVPFREPYDWLLQPWRCGYDGARRYAESVWEALPPDAFLLVFDTMRPPLDYYQGCYGKRLDVCLSYSPYRWSDGKDCSHTRENTDSMVTEGRLFTASADRKYISPWLLDGRFDFVPTGLVFKVVYHRAGGDPVDPSQ